MILGDTGFWLALANRNDHHHKVAKAALAAAKEPLVTTWPVLTETCHLLAVRLHPDAATRFISNAARGAFSVFDLSAAHFERVAELMNKYRSLPMDLADASLVICAEALNSGRIFSTDTRAFGAYRWKNKKPFENLLKI
jgi:predicted nucleic acid-binding protein